jgi:DNA-binding NarL/FixJ family response regulator
MIKLFVIEDHQVTIAGLRSYFRPSRDEIQITRTANSIEEALASDGPDSFDVILLDLWLPSGEPTENYRRIEERFPRKPIVIYTAELSLHWQRKMYKLGAKGFINKKADKVLIESTLERVIKGETVYSSLISEYQTKRVIEGYRNPKYGLTKDQEDIVHLFIEGLPAKEIASKLGRDLSTINKSLKNIRSIFEVSNNIDLIKTILKLEAWKPLDANHDTSLNL